jgi:Cytidylate kinase
VKRREVRRKNYQNLYQGDIDDFNNFDFVWDTTNLSHEDVFEKGVSYIEQSISRKEY